MNGHRLVRRVEDDSPCPLIGEVVGQVDEDTLEVVWGDDRFADEPRRWSWRVPFDELAPAGNGVPGA